MFHHSDDLKFNGQVSRPDPAFADILLSQSGTRQLHPCKYDALFNITELQSI